MPDRPHAGPVESIDFSQCELDRMLL